MSTDNDKTTVTDVITSLTKLNDLICICHSSCVLSLNYIHLQLPIHILTYLSLFTSNTHLMLGIISFALSACLL